MQEKRPTWQWENGAKWDRKKEHVIGNRRDAFNIGYVEIGSQLSGVWGHLQNEDDEILGYGWISLYDDGPEISIAVDEVYQAMGFGSKILEILEKEIKSRRYTYVVATVRNTNILARKIVNWMYANGFVATNFGTSVSVELASKLVEKGQDLNLLKNLDSPTNC